MPDFVVQPGGRRSREHRQAPGVRSGGADGTLQAEDRLEVVVQDVGTGREDVAEGRLVALAVRDEHLDGGARAAPADRRDRLGERGRPTVGQVVAGDGSDDRVRKPHPLHRFGHATGLVGVERERMTRVDETEPAGPRAALAVDHERRRAVGPALEDVRTAGFLADGDEVELAHRRAEPDELGADPQLSPDPLGLAARQGHALRRVDSGVRQPAIERPRRTAPTLGAGRGRAAARCERPAATTRRPGARPTRPRRARSGARRTTASTTSRNVASTPSAAMEVTPRSVRPHGTMWPNIERSGSTFNAKPCIDRPRLILTPMAQIFLGRGPSGSTQTPG